MTIRRIRLYANGKTPEGEKLNINPAHYAQVVGHDGLRSSAIQALAAQVGLDAADVGVFAARALEAVKAHIYKVEYPELKARRLIPAGSEKGQHIRHITFREFDRTGFAKIMTSLSDDAPIVNIRGKEFTIEVKKLRSAYEYTVDDMAEAAAANVPLQTMYAEAVREGFEQAIEKLAWLGDDKHGIPGLIYNPNITAATVPNGATSGTPQWETKTNDEIVADMVFAVTNMQALTNGVEGPADTLLLPIEKLNLIKNRRMASGTDTTVLEFFLRNNPGVTVEPLIWLNDLPRVPSTGAPAPEGFACMLAYKRDPRKLSLEIPMDFWQAPPEARNLAWVVNAMIHYGGVIVYRPLSVHLSQFI